MWEERTSGMASEVSVDKGMCKSWTAGSPRSVKNASQKAIMVIAC